MRTDLRALFLAACSLPMALTATLQAQDAPPPPPPPDPKPATAPAKPDTPKEEPDPALDLEKLFPKHGLFGPSASSPTFSHDGTWAAFNWRTRGERRHGSDLWVVQAGGEPRRVTSAVVMAEFLHDAREVLKDRKEHAKEAAKKGKKGDGKETGDAEGEKKPEGVDHLKYLQDDDVEREKAPRWSGASNARWSPTANELLFTCSGDVFRYRPETDELERLTRTDSGESRVGWLPDGSGYGYEQDGEVHVVRFGSHLRLELDPRLERDESVIGFSFDPTGRRIALTVRKGERGNGDGRRVKIARYTERFVEVREVPRTVSDDPKPDGKIRVYMLSLDGHLGEGAKLVRCHEHEVTGPRDVLSTPQWSPDGERLTFASFTQDTDKLAVFEATWPKEDDGEEDENEEDEDDDDDDDEGEEAEEKKPAKDSDDGEDASRGKVEDHPAKLVYEWLHFGGPNTPRMIEPDYLADGREIVFLSEQSGYRHLHVLDPRYQSVRQLTSGPFEVYPLGFDDADDRSVIWATTTCEHPSRSTIVRIDPKTGAMTRIEGCQDACYEDLAVSPDGSWILANRQRFGDLQELQSIDVSTGSHRPLTGSHDELAAKVTRFRPEFFEFENRHGQVIHGMVTLPPDFDETKKYPCLLYVYGGPLGTRKIVVDGSYHYDAYFLHNYMSLKHGFVTATIDTRGMSGYGALYEKANYEQVGKPQVEDLVDGAKHLADHYGVDVKKVGLHGWSFGGFQTQMCLYTEPEFFACGIAGAGPTEWENYNSWYSTGTIGPSREGKTDLEAFSLLPLAKKLKRPLLLVHGMEDPNVLYQDTVRVYRELLKAGKETLVDLFLDPTGAHGLGGDVERLNRARKYEQWFLRHLKPEALASDD